MNDSERPRWDDTFLNIAREIARRSKDPSTKVGCVIVGPDNEVRSVGYNCFPRGIRDSESRLNDRREKLLFVEHSERNAVYNAARAGISLKGCRIYLPWLPCSDCARAIIQSGIVEVVTDNPNVPARWRRDFAVSLTMLHEAGVLIRRPGGRPVNICAVMGRAWVGKTIKTRDGEKRTIKYVYFNASGEIIVSFKEVALLETARSFADVERRIVEPEAAIVP